jgi:hypothetical protein
MPVISIRVSDEWLAYVDAEAERCRWKRNAAVVNLTWDGLQVRGALGEHPSDSIEPQPANGNVGLNAGMDKYKSGRDVDGHAGGDANWNRQPEALVSGASSQPVAGKPDKQVLSPAAPTSGGKKALAEVSPRKRASEKSEGKQVQDLHPSTKNCPSCGGLNGIHQRRCKG